MAERRDTLAAETAAATEQRQSVQAAVTQLTEDLAARSQQLAQIERRMSEQLQSQEASAAAPEGTEPAAQEGAEPAAEAELAPGTYSAGAVVVTLGEDGRFVLRNDASGQEVTGSYATEAGRLTLSEAKGDVGRTRFPMTCSVKQSDGGLMLEETGDEPCALTGLTLEPQQ